jgi:hypothetical protein
MQKITIFGVSKTTFKNKAQSSNQQISIELFRLQPSIATKDEEKEEGKVASSEETEDKQQQDTYTTVDPKNLQDVQHV